MRYKGQFDVQLDATGREVLLSIHECLHQIL